MMPAAFGALLSGVQSLDSYLDPQMMRALDDADLAECWKTAGHVCTAADALYQKLKQAYADRLINASHHTTGTK